MLRLNGYQFAGTNIKVTQQAPDSSSTSSEPNEMRQLFTSFLSRRYNPELKLLDLSAMGQDQELLPSSHEDLR